METAQTKRCIPRKEHGKKKTSLYQVEEIEDFLGIFKSESFFGDRT